MTLSVTDTLINPTKSSTTATFSGVDFGAATTDRLVVFAIGWERDQIISATIGGIAATIVEHITHFAVSGACIMSAIVPTGTSGDIVVTFNGSTHSFHAGTVYRLTGVETTAFDTGEAAAASSPVATTVDVPTDGILIASGFNRTATGTVTWTGATQDTDQQPNGRRSVQASASGLAVETARAVEIAYSNVTNLSLVTATFEPAAAAPAGRTKVYDGSAFNIKPLKVYDGTSFVDRSTGVKYRSGGGSWL
jgi:hypothetical protein